MFRALKASAVPVMAAFSLEAQAPPAVARLVADPTRITMKAGESVSLKVTALDQAGRPIPDALVRVGGIWNVLAYDAETQQLKALKAGEYELPSTYSAR